MRQAGTATGSGVIGTAVLFTLLIAGATTPALSQDAGSDWGHLSSTIAVTHGRADNDLVRIGEVQAALREGINAGAVGYLFELYGEGAVIVPSYTELRHGRRSIARWYAAVFENFDIRYDEQLTSLELDDDWASVVSSATVTLTPRRSGAAALPGDPVQFRDTVVRVYRRAAPGQWKIDREVWRGEHAADGYLSGLLDPWPLAAGARF